MVASRRKPVAKQVGKPKVVQTKSGVEVTSNYCRFCMTNKPPDQFYSACDNFLDKNSLMSICKDCVDEIFDSFMLTEGTIERTMLKLCRTLNVRYNEDAIAAAQKHIETSLSKGRAAPKFFGIYKQKIMAVQKTEMGSRQTQDLTFEEPPKTTLVSPSGSDKEDELRERWGEGYDLKDLLWLDHELAAWKETHKCSNRAEETLLQEIVAKKLEIRGLRLEGKSTDTAVKALQELMRTAAYDPSKVNQANSGKNKEVFGVWIQEIETMRPAEWWEQNGLYRNLDGIDDYGKKFITEPLKRFVTGSRDFNFDDLGELAELSDGEDDSDVESE